MADVLTHRGPEGHGECVLEGAKLGGWFGHRRLKIIDLSEAAHQPMLSTDGAVALTYNGEIYNFRELKRELERLGHRFTSTGDTEVVLRAYEQWGVGAISRLDGMFALGIWDGREERLLLARDRTGKKPLFYTVADGRLTFGSEIKSLLQAPWVNSSPDPTRLPEFLTYGYVPGAATFWDGIVQVPPASYVIFDASGARPPKEYWDPLPESVERRIGASRLADIATALEDATLRRIVADVPVGVLLSGGIDSSLVLGLLARHLPEPVRTFSIGFADDATYDERGYARLVADHFGSDHTEFVVRADAVALMDRLLWHHDQPYADSSAIPTYLVCSLAREHVTVALNGDGGDEVFAGYDRFVAAAIAERMPRAISRVGRRAITLLPRDHGYYSRRRRGERFFELAQAPARERYQSWTAVLNRDLLEDVLGRPPGNVQRSMDHWYDRASHLPVLDQIVYANFKTYLPDDLAVKMDRMSMANSLETRSPFLDTAVVEQLIGIAAVHKIGLRRVKPLLRRALWDLLPREIWDRRKHGFGVPMNAWFRGPLAEMYVDEVLAPDARTANWLDQAAIKRMWQEHHSGEADHGFRLWTLLTLERWLRWDGRVPAPRSGSGVADASVTA